ncbi:MAG TPA: YtfJ family protein [Bacteroidia bacterium]|nr:YtfJ family protein [Bacteroidia bacterium]
MKKNLSISIALVFIFATLTLFALQINVGKSVSNLKIKTPDDKASNIPFLGEKVLLVLYTDPDVKDVNDPLSDAVREKHYPKEKYVGIGIANCDDTWLPNSMIRYAGRQKQAKYPSSVILVDDNKLVSKAWDLGDCNELGYVLIIGKDSKVKFAKAVKNQNESKAIIASVISTLEAEMAK